jgi:hypothetical protein
MDCPFDLSWAAHHLPVASFLQDQCLLGPGGMHWPGAHVGGGEPPSAQTFIEDPASMSRTNKPFISFAIVISPSEACAHPKQN